MAVVGEFGLGLKFEIFCGCVSGERGELVGDSGLEKVDDIVLIDKSFEELFERGEEYLAAEVLKGECDL